MPAVLPAIIPPESDPSVAASIAAHAALTTDVHGTGTVVTSDNIGAFAPAPDLSALVAIAPTTSARNVIQPSAADVKPLIVKGAANQSENLQEWQTADGTKRVAIGAPGSSAISVRGASAGAGIPQEYFVQAVEFSAPYYGTTAGFDIGSLTHFVVGGDYVDFVAQNRGNYTVGIDTAYYAASTPNVATLGGRVNVYTRHAAAKGLVIQAAAAQTVNLTEWQNSAGTVLAAIVSDGGVYGTRHDGPRGGMYQGSGDGRLGFGSGGVPSVRLGANLGPSGNASAYEWSPSGTTTISARHSANGEVTFEGHTGHTTNIVIRASASQSGNLTEWKNAAGAVFARISPNAAALLNLGLQVNSANDPNVEVVPGDQFRRGIVIRGAAPQSANLFETRDSALSILVKIEPSGIVTAADFKALTGGGTRHISLGTDTTRIYGSSASIGLRVSNVDILTMSTMGVEIPVAGAGLKLKSPNGAVTRTLTIDNAGALVVA